jgi:hypothetical protein
MHLVFKILLIFLLLTAFFPPFRRFLFHLLVGRQLIKEQKRANQASGRAQKRGGVNVDFVPPTANESNLKGGEYVDYEEVK